MGEEPIQRSFSYYLEYVARKKSTYSHWRMGQTYFNVLEEMRPDLAEYIRGTHRDPFHSDHVIGEFLSFVIASW